METAVDRYALHFSADYTTVKIPEAIKAQLEALPDVDSRGKTKIWEPWEDRIILEYYDKKAKADLGKVLRVCSKSVVKRYKQLTGEIE